MVNRISETVSSGSSFEAKFKKENVDMSVETDLSIKSLPEKKITTNEAIEGEQNQLSSDKAKKLTDSMNEILEMTNTELRYQYHEDLDRYYVSVVNANTDEVIREIPSKKLMDIYAAMLDFAGILVDEKI